MRFITIFSCFLLLDGALAGLVPRHKLGDQLGELEDHVRTQREVLRRGIWEEPFYFDPGSDARLRSKKYRHVKKSIAKKLRELGIEEHPGIIYDDEAHKVTFALSPSELRCLDLPHFDFIRDSNLNLEYLFDLSQLYVDISKRRFMRMKEAWFHPQTPLLEMVHSKEIHNPSSILKYYLESLAEVIIGEDHMDLAPKAFLFDHMPYLKQ